MTLQVICAPHITELSKTLGTSFSPIRYILKGNRIVSNVRYGSSVFKEGWLSASGRVEASGSNTLQVLFDRFWIDFGSTKLREEVTGMHVSHTICLNACEDLALPGHSPLS